MASKVNKFGPSSGEIVYCNADLLYTDPNPNRFLPAQLSLTRTTPVVDYADDYLVTIARFSVDCAALPLCAAEVQLNQGNPNLTPWGFVVSGPTAAPGIDTVGAVAYVTYVPTDYSAPVPGPVGAAQDYSSGYYFVYDYASLIAMFNTTIAAAIANFAVAGGDVTGLVAPQIYFDNSLGVISITAKLSQWCTGGTGVNAPPAAPYLLEFNGKISSFFIGLPFDQLSNSAGTQAAYEFRFDQQANNVAPRPTLDSDATAPWVTISMSNTAQVGYWSSLNTVIIQTNMPVTPEATQPAYGTGGLDSSNTLAMLTDFVIDSSAAGQWNAEFVYTPDKWERFYSLSGSTPLSKLQFNLLWTDARGNTFTFWLRYNTKISLKLAFVSRAYWMSSRRA
jgi:hypothetical protein